MSDRKLLIIDTDPGVDDAMAILAAFNSPDVDVIGLTTIFGNVRTPQATANAIVLRELAGREHVPVAPGSHTTLQGLAKVRVADFVHGADGFGNLSPAMLPAGLASEVSAAQFLCAECARRPGQVTVLALGPLTNIALAMQLDSSFMQNMAELVVLGGAFLVNGNVNPAAEANVFGDPHAADLVFGGGCNIRVVGLDVTHEVVMSGHQLTALDGKGRHGGFLHKISRFYLQYHKESYGTDAIFVHDPTAMAAVLAPDLFTWATGQVRVVTEGIAAGQTIMDRGLKRWNAPNAWSNRPGIQVALGVQSEKVVQLMWELMSA